MTIDDIGRDALRSTKRMGNESIQLQLTWCMGMVSRNDDEVALNSIGTEWVHSK